MWSIAQRAEEEDARIEESDLRAPAQSIPTPAMARLFDFLVEGVLLCLCFLQSSDSAWRTVNVVAICSAIVYRASFGDAAWPTCPNWRRRFSVRTLTGEAHPGMSVLQRVYRHYLDLRFLALQWFHICAWHLDEILFPGFKDIDIKDPVFLVGGFRTGSTSLHRLMAMDDDRYISPKLFEVAIPYLWFQYILAGVEYADERWNLGIIAKFDANLERALGKEVLERHPMSWHSAEECDMLLGAYMWCGYYAYGISPDPKEMLVNGQISKFPPAEVDRIFNFYKRSIQKIMYRRGANRTLLSKSHLIELMPVFKERFSGARFVGIMRDPKDTFVSWLSLCRPMTATLNLRYNVPLKMDVDAHFKFLDLFGKAERSFFLDDREEGDEKRIHSFAFKEFVTNQEGVLFSLYKEWGVDISTQFQQALEAARAEHKNYKKKHNYKNPTFKELGVEESFVIQEFEAYNRAFGTN